MERTGKDQRDAGYVHSEDVKTYLMERLNVAKVGHRHQVLREGRHRGNRLADDGCPIEWIITKAALQEGWDCPFAYILVSLNNTASQQSMTQLVGRVLRQPDVTQDRFRRAERKLRLLSSQESCGHHQGSEEGSGEGRLRRRRRGVVDRSGDSKPPSAKREALDQAGVPQTLPQAVRGQRSICRTSA